MSDDGWGIGNPVDKIVEAYECIEADVEKNPVEREVKEPKDPSKKIPIISTVKEDQVFYLPDTDDDDDHYVSRPGRKKQFFKPPLQVQRNHYVKNTIKNFVNNRNFVFKKLAVLGCGESSLEKFFCHDLSGIGFERVISVDIDEAALATGIRLLRHSLKMHECHIKQSSRLPVLFEHYLGSILEYDERLAGVDCVCSTEVIEHIPLEDAEKYARLVLDQIRPKLFILSTPNHEYNKAFGMEPGQFRHDDHKYEFTRIEFIDWVKKLLAETSPGYKYEMHYVGNTPDFHELQGATQFALFYRDGEVKEKPFAPVRNYQKAAASIAYEGLYTILAARGRLGLKTWLQRNTLDKTNLKVTEYAKFWEIPLDEIIVLMGISLYILADISRQKLLDMLKAVSRGKLFSTYGGDEANDSEHFIVVPGDCRLDILIDSL